MKIAQQQYGKIADIFALPERQCAINNLTMLNSILGLPSSFSKWHSIYTRMSHWNKYT